jgi:hypothetical protein
MTIYILRIANQILLPNFLRKLKAFWFRKKNQISEPKKEFIRINSGKWEPEDNVSNEKGYCLIEGFLADYGPNYLLRTAVIAKAIKEKLNIDPLVMFENGIRVEEERVNLYKSFKIESFVSTLNYFPSFFQRLKNFTISLKLFFAIKHPDQILKLNYQGIAFGDLLYDTILKASKGTFSISKSGIRELYHITVAVNLITIYEKLMKNIRIKFFISTHSQYLHFGIPLRMALQLNIPVIETTDIQLWMHTKVDNAPLVNYPKYHDYLKWQIKKIIPHQNRVEVVKKVEKMLNDRFSGLFEQSDVKLAYGDKKLYTKDSLREKLEIKNDYPFVFVFAHVFADAPQGLSSGMLFRDYFVWLEETLKKIKEVQNVNWIIKPHPSSKLYNETGVVDEMVKKMNTDNIKICPADLNPASVIKVANAVITAQGTVGIEYSCMGIPVVLTSKPFYSEFNFTIEPETVADYMSILENVLSSEKLSTEQMNAAKLVFSTFMDLQQTDTSLIDTDVLLSVWGGDGRPSSDRAFDIVNKKLATFDFKKYSLYSKTVEMIEHFQNI